MKMIKTNLVIIFLFSVNLVSGQNEINGKKYESIDDLINAFDMNNVNEAEYDSFVSQAKGLIEVKKENLVEKDLILHSDIQMRFLVSNLPASLYSFKNVMLKNAISTGSDLSFLGLAMIQDTRALEPLMKQVIKSNYSPIMQEFYISLFALYGDKAKSFLPFLDYMEVFEWHPNIKSLIADVKEKIKFNKANNDWSRYKIWKNYERDRINFCSYYPIYESGQESIDRLSASSSINNITVDGENILKRNDINKDNVVFHVKIDNDQRYIVKLNKHNGKTFLLENSQKYEIQGVDKLWIHGYFSAGDRSFFITSWTHGGNGRTFIEELIWDFDAQSYDFEVRFDLASNYKELIKSEKEVLVIGKNWKFVIDSENAVIKEGEICGSKVKINKTL